MKTYIQYAAAMILAGSLVVGCGKSKAEQEQEDAAKPIPHTVDPAKAAQSLKASTETSGDKMKDALNKGADATKDAADKLKDKVDGAMPAKP